eukprot:6968123-Prymnesium_polylepis.1
MVFGDIGPRLVWLVPLSAMRRASCVVRRASCIVRCASCTVSCISYVVAVTYCTTNPHPGDAWILGYFSDT